MDVGYSRRQRSRDMSWGCVRLGPDLDFAVERPLYGFILSTRGGSARRQLRAEFRSLSPECVGRP